MQGQYSVIKSDTSQMCYKNNSGNFYHDRTAKSKLMTLFILLWKRVWIDRCIRKIIPALKELLAYGELQKEEPKVKLL